MIVDAETFNVYLLRAFFTVGSPRILSLNTNSVANCNKIPWKDFCEHNSLSEDTEQNRRVTKKALRNLSPPLLHTRDGRGYGDARC